jgi:hypothetical protein
MISQNRTDEKRSVLAGAAWGAVQREEVQNEELLRISRRILALVEQDRDAMQVLTSEGGSDERSGS